MIPQHRKRLSLKARVFAVWPLFALSIVFQSQPMTLGQDRSRDLTPVEDFTRNRPKGNQRKSSGRRQQVYRLTAGRPNIINTPTSSNGQIGITIWHLRPAMQTEPGARILLWGAERAEHVAQRVSSETPLPRGGKVRLSIESARTGYLYVINRGLFADGSAGPARLMFPVRKMRDNDNKVRPGRLVDIPGQQDEPNYLDATPGRRDQVGELVIVLVTAEPLNLPLSNFGANIPAAELATWEKKWGGGAQKLEMVGGVGQQWTSLEKEAATDSGRRLREDEPPPQTVFRLPEGKDDGLMVSITLRYQRAKPKSRR